MILDLNSERQDLNLLISKALNRQDITNLIQPIHIPGEKLLSFFYIKDKVAYENIDEINKFAYSNLIITDAPKNIVLILKYNDESLYDIDFKYYQISDLSQLEREEIDNFTKWLRKHRILKYLKNNNLKAIRRNEKCPCGSGKKYKYCCSNCNTWIS